MNVKFHLNKKDKPDSEDGIKVVYGQAKRGGYKLRWYFILAIVISPVVLMTYYLFKDNIWITAPGIITSYPVTVTANFDGTVGHIPLKIGDQVETDEHLFSLQNRTLNQEIVFLQQEIKKLDISQHEDFSTYKDAITHSQENMKQIESIRRRFDIYRAEGQVSDVEYANMLNQSNIAKTQLSAQTIDLEQAQDIYKEKRLAGVIPQAKRALEKELVLKADQQASLSLSSPFSGRIVDIPATEGEMVEKGAPLVTIAPNIKPSVIAYLDPKYLAEATLGKHVKVEFPDGKYYKATLSQEIQIVSQLPNQLVKPFEGQPSFLKVTIAIDDPLDPSRWIEGMSVQVLF